MRYTMVIARREYYYPGINHAMIIAVLAVQWSRRTTVNMTAWLELMKSQTSISQWLINTRTYKTALGVETQVLLVLLLVVNVNFMSSGAQNTYLATVKSPETDSSYSASVRTQHSGRAKAAMITWVMELSECTGSDAGAVNSTATIRPI